MPIATAAQTEDLLRSDGTNGIVVKLVPLVFGGRFANPSNVMARRTWPPLMSQHGMQCIVAAIIASDVTIEWEWQSNSFIVFLRWFQLLILGFWILKGSIFNFLFRSVQWIQWISKQSLFPFVLSRRKFLCHKGKTTTLNFDRIGVSSSWSCLLHNSNASKSIGNLISFNTFALIPSLPLYWNRTKFTVK